MKKILYSLGIILFLLGWFPISVLAQGSITVSTGSLSMTTGGSSTFRITASNAAGKVTISSSNPAVASVSSALEWVENGSVTITVYGKSAGSAKITVTVSDAATFDEEELHNVYNINVAVNNPAPTPTPTPTPTPPKPNTPAVSPVTGNDNRSSNANLKNIEVEGYKLTKTDDTHYTLTVRNSIDKIKILATPEDAKATVQGAGEVSLQVGENPFDVAVTAENGTVKHYYVQVTRKDNQYTLERIIEALSDDDATILLNEDSVLSKNHLKLIEDSKKKIELVRLDENKKVLYTFVVDGSKIDSFDDIHLNAQLAFSDIHQFDQLSGYRKGLYFQFLKQDSFPKGISVKLPVKNQYTDGEKVKVYSYDSQKKKIQLRYKDVVVKDQSVEVPLTNNSQYFVTQANIGNDGEIHSYKIAAIVEFGLLVLMTVMMAVLCIRHRSSLAAKENS